MSLKGILIFIGLKLAEIAGAIALGFVVYHVGSLVPGKVWAFSFIGLIAYFVAFAIISDTQWLKNLYWYDGKFIKFVGVTTIAASFLPILMFIGWLGYYLGNFYNYIFSLFGVTLVKPTPDAAVFVVAGIVFTFGFLVVGLLFAIWIAGNIEWTKNIIAKQQRELDNQE